MLPRLDAIRVNFATHNQLTGNAALLVGCGLKSTPRQSRWILYPTRPAGRSYQSPHFYTRLFPTGTPIDNIMLHQNPNQEPTFGYLSTVQLAELGYFGGYLVISALGRPLEFHCTAPVRPNRAQEILYGPTLEPYLLGEQIGGTLLGRAKLTPRLILTDRSATLCLRGQIATPMVRLVHREDAPRTSHTLLSTPHGGSNGNDNPERPNPPCDRMVVVAEREFELPIGFDFDRETVVELLATLAQYVEVAEPFDRIQEAIREAQRIGTRGHQDGHGQAA